MADVIIASSGSPGETDCSCSWIMMRNAIYKFIPSTEAGSLLLFDLLLFFLSRRPFSNLDATCGVLTVLSAFCFCMNEFPFVTVLKSFTRNEFLRKFVTQKAVRR